MTDTAIENCFTSRQSIARLYELVKVTSYWTTWSVQSTSLHSGTAGQSAGGKIIPCLAFPQLPWYVQVKCSDGAVMSQLWFLQPESQFLILIFPPPCCRGAESLGVRLVDGPGRCAGRLEIQHGSPGDESVEDNESIRASLPRICQLLECGNEVRAVQEKFSPGPRSFFPLAVKCDPGAKNISDCIEYNVNQPRGKGEALMLTCKGEHAAN